MILADALSRLPNPKNKEDVPLDVAVDSIAMDDVEDDIQVDLVNFGSKKQEEIQKETMRVPILRTLCQVINEGWPDQIKEIPRDIRPYWVVEMN
jgi:hypothetical protein